MPLAVPTARYPPPGLNARLCTYPRGLRDVGQLENTVKLGRCTKRSASFVIRLAMARICTKDKLM